jgi:TatA/E family protein of Tat protein translocase
MVANLFGPDLGIVVIVIVVVLLAGSQLPKIARNVGSAGREFKKAQQEADEEAARDKQAQAARSAAEAPAGAIPAGPAPATPAPQPPSAPTANTSSPDALPPSAGGGDPATINLTPAQLDALLKAREDQVRKETAPDN